MSLTFVQRYKLLNSDCIFHISGIDHTEKQAQFLLLVNAEKEETLTRHINDKIIDISQYGEIIYSCYGDDIDEYSKHAILKKHGFNV